MKGEEGGPVVPEGEDRDGDEVLEQPPPNPVFYPSPSGCKRP